MKGYYFCFATYVVIVNNGKCFFRCTVEDKSGKQKNITALGIGEVGNLFFPLDEIT